MGALNRHIGQLQRPPTERIPRNHGVLGAVTRSRMKLDVMLAMDPKYLKPLTRIMDPESFFEGALELEASSKKASRFMSHHLPAMTEMGAVEELKNKNAIYMPIFTTVKKSGELRLIQDCRWLNARYVRPETMELPRIHEVIRKILRAKFAAQADAVSYFFQFPLAHGIRHCFASRLCGARGLYTDVQYTAMPMGWSHAPSIAQRCSNILVRDLGIAWVDNFIVLADDYLGFIANREEFLKRTHAVNVLLDDESLSPNTSLIALGMEFDLNLKRYRMDPKWITKASARLETILSQEHVTTADLYVIGGTLTWRNHVVQRKLCNMPHTFQRIGDAASRIAKGTLKWTDSVKVSPELQLELREELQLLSSNAWIHLPDGESTPTADVWSDASDERWAFLLIEEGLTAVARTGPTKEELHIFYSELSAALGGIIAARRRGHKHVRVYIDNAPAAHALRRGVSSNFRANKWLAAVQDMTLDVIWVPSKQQLADLYTRRIPIRGSKGVTGYGYPSLPRPGTPLISLHPP